ncbi:MAG: hypothetical protein J1E40_10480 [Oscillospiraceae bacterium]|nr:hypothetical protein [Oscillospiraceae bacterium]
MTVKRTFLNIGIILTMIALAMLVSQIYENFCMVEAEGTVKIINVMNDVEKADYRIVYENGRGIWRFPVEQMSGYDFSGYDFRNTLSVGDKVIIYCDKRTGEPIMSLSDKRHYVEIALFGVPGIILVVLGFSAIKGYYSEFFCKFPIQFFFSVITWAFLIYIWVDSRGFANSWNGLIIYPIILVNAVLNALIWTITWVVCMAKRQKSEIISHME